MQTWFECKVKYLKIDQGGYERKVNDTYLLDAVSFTDAEARIFFQMQQLTRGEFQVTNIKKSNISEIIPAESGEWWYKAKINLVTIDEEAGKEKKVTNYALVMADDINEALKRLDQGLSYMLVPYVTTSIMLSPIADVFPYFEGEEQPIKKAVAATSAKPVARPSEEEEEVEEEIPEDELEETIEDELEDDLEEIDEQDENEEE